MQHLKKKMLVHIGGAAAQGAGVLRSKRELDRCEAVWAWRGRPDSGSKAGQSALCHDRCMCAARGVGHFLERFRLIFDK